MGDSKEDVGEIKFKEVIIRELRRVKLAGFPELGKAGEDKMGLDAPQQSVLH